MIPAHNEESVISNTVQNILSMDYDNFDVIVIDDRSTDNTSSVIKDLEAKYENFHYFGALAYEEVLDKEKQSKIISRSLNRRLKRLNNL